MPRYIISLGSNLADGEKEINAAIEWLAEIATLISPTPTYSTPDIHGAGKPPYTNALATIRCDLPADNLNDRLKEYELSRGRMRANQSVVIDLDLVCRDDEILRPRDYCAPYFVEGLYLLASASKSSGNDRL